MNLPRHIHPVAKNPQLRDRSWVLSQQSSISPKVREALETPRKISTHTLRHTTPESLTIQSLPSVPGEDALNALVYITVSAMGCSYMAFLIAPPTDI